MTHSEEIFSGNFVDTFGEKYNVFIFDDQEGRAETEDEDPDKEIGLWFDLSENKLTSFDGVYSAPDELFSFLKRHGFDVSDI